MQTATTHAQSAPAPWGKGFTHPKPVHTGRCLLHSDTLTDSLKRAKTKQRYDERGAAYHELLREFHRRILPAFLIETGSIAGASHLLGIHRETLSRYMELAGIDPGKTYGGQHE